MVLAWKYIPVGQNFVLNCFWIAGILDDTKLPNKLNVETHLKGIKTLRLYTVIKWI